MPHYFFDVDDGVTVTRDSVGITFSDREQARAEAQRCLPQLASHLPPSREKRVLIVRMREDGEHAIFEARLELSYHWLA